MIIGVGIDIIEIKRIEKGIENSKFIYKVFNEVEIKDNFGNILKANSLAGKFAAKEAVAKALGTGFRGISLKDISVLKDSLGKPYIILNHNADKKAKEFGDYKIHISISHSRDNAIAYAILEV